MTHTNTEQERKLFEAVASDDGKWPQAIERDAKGVKKVTKPSINWEHVRDEYKFLAQDASGKAWEFDWRD